MPALLKTNKTTKRMSSFFNEEKEPEPPTKKLLKRSNNSLPNSPRAENDEMKRSKTTPRQNNKNESKSPFKLEKRPIEKEPVKDNEKPSNVQKTSPSIIEQLTITLESINKNQKQLLNEIIYQREARTEQSKQIVELYETMFKNDQNHTCETIRIILKSFKEMMKESKTELQDLLLKQHENWFMFLKDHLKKKETIMINEPHTPPSNKPSSRAMSPPVMVNAEIIQNELDDNEEMELHHTLSSKK